LEIADMAPLSPFIRLTLFALGLAVASLSLAGAAYAQSCGDDLKRLSEKREAELNRVNALVKANKGKPMDPQVFCSQSSGLNTAEAALIAYMEKNKDWCGVPEDALAALKANHVKSLGFAHKACTVAAQMRQMKKQQEAGGNGAPQAQHLPAGPL
jgi:hypothetical protein